MLDESRSLGFRKSAEAVKAEVSPARYVEDQGIEAKHLHTDVHKIRCISRNHEDREPSMYLYGAKAHCYGCGFHGDVIDLAFIVEDHRNMFAAMVSLAGRYGIDIPEKPDAFFAKQRRQKSVRDAIENLQIERLRGRCFRIWGEPLLIGIENPDELREDTQMLWDAVLPIAERIHDAGMRR